MGNTPAQGDNELKVVNKKTELSSVDSNGSLSPKELQYLQMTYERNRVQQLWIRDTFIGGFILMLIVSALIFHNYLRKTRANSRLKSLNNEIKKQQLELADQAFKVQELNESLSAINETLEMKIEARTKELYDKNSELALKNRKLEEFAFINAHRLRAPIARLIGLTQIIQTDDLEDYGRNNMVESIKNCSVEIDQVVRQIAIKIRRDVRNGQNMD